MKYLARMASWHLIGGSGVAKKAGSGHQHRRKWQRGIYGGGAWRRATSISGIVAKTSSSVKKRGHVTVENNIRK